jgi:hypothetical protein
VLLLIGSMILHSHSLLSARMAHVCRCIPLLLYLLCLKF